MSILPGSSIAFIQEVQSLLILVFVLSQTTYVNVAVFRIPDEEGIDLITDPREIQPGG